MFTPQNTKGLLHDPRTSKQDAHNANIILIGMPGAGKSTAGIVAAKMLAYDFIDADLVIQNRYNKTLQTLIDSCGSEGFIKIEDTILQSLAVHHTVIATGGSAVYSEDAMHHLRTLGTIIYLEISFEEMMRRIPDLERRGIVLREGQDMSMRALFNERKPLYEKYAQVTINVENLTVAEAAREITLTVQ